MSDVNSQMQNSQNLQKLVEEMLSRGSNGKAIEYKQASWLVLLGSGHSRADEQRVKNTVGDWTFEGSISVQMYQNEGRFKMKVIPKTSQESERRQLETAVEQAVQGMTIPSRQWRVQFGWPN